MTNPIKAKRKSLGLTQMQFANKANIPLRTYKRYEAEADNKEYRTPDVIVAIKIGETLGVTSYQEFCSLWKSDKCLGQSVQ